MSEGDPNISHEAYGFVERQMALLGDQDPLRVLVQTPGLVAGLFGSAEPAAIHRPWAEGKWTPFQVLVHMKLTEWIFGFRTRTILFDDEPLIQPVDQNLWIERLDHPSVADEADQLSDFAALRRANLRLWRALTPEQLGRTGRHAEAGVEMSLDFLLRLLAGHDLNHLGQLREGLE